MGLHGGLGLQVLGHTKKATHLNCRSELARDGFKTAVFTQQTHALSLATIASKLAPTRIAGLSATE